MPRARVLRQGRELRLTPRGAQAIITPILQNVDLIEAIYTSWVTFSDSGGEKYWTGRISAGRFAEEAARRIATAAQNDLELIEADDLQNICGVSLIKTDEL